MGFSQRDNAMLTQVETFLKEYGFPHGRKPSRGTNGDVANIAIYQRPEILRFLGSIRPVRLLDKFQPSILGRLPLKNRVMLVQRVEVGVQEVVALTTSTGTFLAEGLASHNCCGRVQLPGGLPQSCSGRVAGQSSMRAPMTATWSARASAGRPGSLPVSSLTRASR